MTVRRDQPLHPAWRTRLHEVIFEADTAVGRAFDVLLLWCIVLSILAVLLELNAEAFMGRSVQAGTETFHDRPGEDLQVCDLPQIPWLEKI